MRPHEHEARKLRAQLAHDAVMRQARAGALPVGDVERAAEGALRAERARQEVAEQVKARTPCTCRPGDAVAWGRAIVEVVQAVYTLLKTLGIIRPNGGAA